MIRRTVLTCLLLVGLAGGAVIAATAPDRKAMPQRDVVDVPSLSQGLCVSNAFQTNMVLQRDKPLNIWGWAEPGEEVTVSFGGQQAQAEAAADRSWQVTLKPITANSTPQTLTVRGKVRTLTLENILVGDVWVLGGQSNMEFPLSNVDDGELEVVSANFPQIRLLTMPVGKGFDSVRSFERLYEWSDWSSRHFRKGDWDICSPQSVPEFSAIGYIFGRRVFMATGVPIGLIDASIGGTTVEAWTPQEVLAKINGNETRDMLQGWADRIAAFDPQADLKTRITVYENRMKDLKAKGQPIPADSAPPSDLRPGPAADKNRPGRCYAGVIRPLRGLAVAGALFHQGYNNAFNGSAGARMYYQVFGRMIGAWRDTFGDPRMPFCIISLCTDQQPQTRENFLLPMYDAGVLLREAQYRTFCDLRNAGDKTIGFVSSFDLRKAWYHPQIKIPVGERAAKWALVTHYETIRGRDAEDYWLPPTIKEARIVDGTIRLTMSTAIKAHDDSEGKLVGFAIAGKDRRFYPAEVNWYADGTKDRSNQLQYKRDMLVLSSPFAPQPLHYRHAWARNPMSNLVNNRGVPLATQRSDDWILEETPEKVLTPPDMPPDTARRYIANRLRKELELGDLERQIKEAETIITELKPVYEKGRADLEKKKAADTAMKPAPKTGQ